jgi:hypothetical protein
MDLLSLVKTSLDIPITETSEDEYLNHLVTFVKAQFTKYTGVEISATKDVSQIFLRQYGVSIFKFNSGPINSLVSVTVDGEVQDISNFYISNQLIVSTDQLYGEKIEIVANVGYATIPDDIAYIISAMCEYYFKQDSKSNYFTGDKPLTPSANLLPAYIREMLDGFKI